MLVMWQTWPLSQIMPKLTQQQYSYTAKKVEQKEEVTKINPDSSDSCRTIIVRWTSTEAKAPPAMLWLNQKEKNKFQIAATADTECSVTIPNNQIAERENLKLHKLNIPRLLTATGQISQSTNGSKRVLRQMVLQIRRNSRGTILDQKTSGRHHHLGRQQRRTCHQNMDSLRKMQNE